MNNTVSGKFLVPPPSPSTVRFIARSKSLQHAQLFLSYHRVVNKLLPLWRRMMRSKTYSVFRERALAS